MGSDTSMPMISLKKRVNKVISQKNSKEENIRSKNPHTLGTFTNSVNFFWRILHARICFFNILFLTLLSPYLPPKIESNKRKYDITYLGRIFFYEIHDRIPKVVPKTNKYSTPKGSTNGGEYDKWGEFHTKYPSRY